MGAIRFLYDIIENHSIQPLKPATILVFKHSCEYLTRLTSLNFNQNKSSMIHRY